MTTCVIRKLAADEHRIQESSTIRDFREHWIVLEGVWIDRLRAIEGLALGKPLRLPIRPRLLNSFGKKIGGSAIRVG